MCAAELDQRCVGFLFRLRDSLLYLPLVIHLYLRISYKVAVHSSVVICEMCIRKNASFRWAFLLTFRSDHNCNAPPWCARGNSISYRLAPMTIPGVIEPCLGSRIQQASNSQLGRSNSHAVKVRYPRLRKPNAKPNTNRRGSGVIEPRLPIFDGRGPAPILSVFDFRPV